MSQSGIYLIRNKKNRKCYVGSAVNLQKRRKEHYKRLRRNAHYNFHLQHAFNKYGKGNFVWIVAELCDAEDLIEREQFWIDFYGINNVYNILPTAGSMLGMKHTLETRKRLSEANKGKKHSIETKKKIAEAGRKRKHSLETRKRMIEAHKNVSLETRKKISEAKIGKKCSLKTRKKISEAQRKRRQQKGKSLYDTR